MGLTDEEYSLIVRQLGREPNLVELGMYAVMWSEHCSYKSSKRVLSYFGEYKKAVEGAGLENAGVVDIGGGWGVAIKVESHNHPSAVEPHQGAATGVGGIIRDILSMGARPVALLNSLRFGPLAEAERSRWLFEHVVAGIGGYGNCVGVPTVAGEVDFHPSYTENPLVNAMCVGIVRLDQVATAGAAGVGNPVLYLGSATGKDGIHGATFASDVLDEDSEERRPNVQIGDPFAGKLLIEATLEALATGAVQSIQDMGAAGLTCSTTEMSAKGGVGMEIDLALVPFREPDTTAYEAMLSESQERMLCVAHAGREDEVLGVFRRWGLHAEVVGRVTEGPMVRIWMEGRLEAEVDARPLADGCPALDLRGEEPEWFRASSQWKPDGLVHPDPKQALLGLLADPGVGSKRWVTRQFDQQVMAQTVLPSGRGEAAVVAPRGYDGAIAVTLDGNSRWVAADPYVGGQLAVAEAARNIACTGATPVAATDGLNYGDPNDPEVYWAFERSVRGLADAADALGVPVVSGNVSFYNEGTERAVRPTPLVGMAGVLASPDHAVGSAFPSAPCEVVLLGRWDAQDPGRGLGASRYTEAVAGVEAGRPVPPDLRHERNLIVLLAQAAAAGELLCAKDVSDGGLAVALAECSVAGRVGADVDLGTWAQGLGSPELLFGEWPGVVVVAARSSTALLERAARSGVPALAVGTVGTDRLRVRHGTASLDASVAELTEAYEGTIPAFFPP
jgi:phosphoribosylformylglycinamidine synthase